MYRPYDTWQLLLFKIGLKARVFSEESSKWLEVMSVIRGGGITKVWCSPAFAFTKTFNNSYLNFTKNKIYNLQNNISL